MTNLKRVIINDLLVAEDMFRFVEDELLPDSGISPKQLWSGIADLLNDMVPINRELLAKRETLQQQIDTWHKANINKDFELEAYKSFLYEIGYLQPDCDDFHITTSAVDNEIALQAGPQLVVPVKMHVLH